MRFQHILNNQILRKVATLVNGALIAQLIVLFTAPVVGRLYSPADFALLTVFTSVAAVLLPFVSGRLELAITVNNKIASDTVVIGAAAYAFLVSLIIFIISLLFYFDFLPFVLKKLDSLGELVLLLAPFVLVQALGRFSSFERTRFDEFKRISFTKVAQASVVAVLRLLLFRFSLGLVISDFCGLVLQFFLLKKRTLMSLFNLKAFSCISQTMKSFWRFPVYNASFSVFNAASTNAPIFIILNNLSQDDLGVFGLVVKYILVPFSFLGTAISQVLLREFSCSERQKKGLRKHILKYYLYMLAIGGVPVFIVSLFCEELIRIVFGDQWLAAGSLVVWLLPLALHKTIVSSLSVVFSNLNRLEVSAVWQVLYFFSSYTILVFFARGSSLQMFVKIYFFHEFFFYCAYFVLELIYGDSLKSKPEEYVGDISCE